MVPAPWVAGSRTLASRWWGVTSAATHAPEQQTVRDRDRDREGARLLSVGELRCRLGTATSPTERKPTVLTPPTRAGVWGAAPVAVPLRGPHGLQPVPPDHPGRPSTLLGCDPIGDPGDLAHPVRGAGRGARRGPWRVAPRLLIGSLAGTPAIAAVACALWDGARRRTADRVVWLCMVPDDPPTFLPRHRVEAVGWAAAADRLGPDQGVTEAGVWWRVGLPGDPRPSLSLVARLADRGRELGAAVIVEAAPGVEEMRRALVTQRPDLAVICCGRDALEIRRAARLLEQAQPGWPPTGGWRAVVAVHGGDRWRPEARAALACLPEPSRPVDLRLRRGRRVRVGPRRSLDRILAAAVAAADHSNR